MYAQNARRSLVSGSNDHRLWNDAYDGTGETQARKRQ